jgi:hypothetical protein
LQKDPDNANGLCGIENASLDPQLIEISLDYTLWSFGLVDVLLFGKCPGCLNL